MTRLFIILICSVATVTKAQTVYLSEIKTKNDFRYPDTSINIPINYWRFDTCLYLQNKICKYNTSTAANIKIIQTKDYTRYLFAKSNHSGYKSKHMNDSLTYYFFPTNIDTTFLIRKLWVDKGSDIKADIYIFKTDTFRLKITDTLYFYNKYLVNKIFGKNEIGNKGRLKILVFKSVDINGSVMLHYWVENIGIIKLTDEKCWRYSFEMKDNRTKSIEKMFEKLIQVIKVKYKDPRWPSEQCYFE
jgi:hypothetical protein